MASVGPKIGDVEDVRQQADEREPGADADQRGQQRQQHRQQRAERQEDHDTGGDDADQLRQARSSVGRRRPGSPAPPSSTCRFGVATACAVVDDGLGRAGGDGRPGAVEVDGRVGDRAVLGDLAGARRCVGADDRLDVRQLADLRRASG